MTTMTTASRRHVVPCCWCTGDVDLCTVRRRIGKGAEAGESGWQRQHISPSTPSSASPPQCDRIVVRSGLELRVLADTSTEEATTGALPETTGPEREGTAVFVKSPDPQANEKLMRMRSQPRFHTKSTEGLQRWCVLVVALVIGAEGTDGLAGAP